MLPLHCVFEVTRSVAMTTPISLTVSNPYSLVSSVVLPLSATNPQIFISVLIMMNAFSKFTIVVVMPNQQAKTVAKALVDRWF